MPVFWRYLLRTYFKVLLLCVGSFIAILLITRLKEIARFAALGSSFSSTILFTIYQIPYILPIAIPISCLISSILLFQRLSHTHELTALRSCGLGLKEILSPILFAAAMLAIANFFICSEISTRCRLLTREMLNDETSLNPLLILQRQKFSNIKDAFIDLDASEDARYAKDITFVTYNHSNARLSLLSAESLALDHDDLLGTNVSILSHMKTDEDNFDTLMIENQASMSTPSFELSQFLKKSYWRLNSTSLPFRMLLIRALAHEDLKPRSDASSYIEMIRRISLGLSAFTLTFIGMAFGMQISRTRSKKGILLATSLTLFVLGSYMFAKGLKKTPFISASVYLIPHPLIIALGSLYLRRISGGKE